MKKAQISLKIDNRLTEIVKKLSLDGSTEAIKKFASAVCAGSVATAGSALFPLVGCVLLHTVITQFSKSKDKAILNELNEEFNKLTKELPDDLETIRYTQLAELEKILNIEIRQKKLITIAQEVHADVKINKRSLDEISEHLYISIDEINNFHSKIYDFVSKLKLMLSDAQQERMDHEHESIKRHKELLLAIKKEVSAEIIDNRNDTILNKSFDLSDELPAIPREEVEKIWEILWGNADKNSVLLSGKAGIGKSGIMHQLSVKLNKEGIPFLYIKLDAIDQVDTTMKLGEQLFCGFAQSPVDVVTALYPGEDVVIIIDQLDELSEAPGRSPEFFSCIDLLFKEARNFSNIRFVLACREFDLENDLRLRALKSQNGIALEIKALPLNEAIVKETVESMGFSQTLLTSQQLQLLQNPLHLFLLVQTSCSFEKGKVLDFCTINDLYKRYWAKKKGDTSRRMNGENCQWENVIDKISEHMSSHQQLMISKYLLDDYNFTVDAMISEHILMELGNNLAFFHSTFFDYAFARRFCIQGKDLLEDILLANEQHLFRRDQIRQVLYLLREINFDKYLQTLQGLLGNSKIRYHLKKTTIQFLQLLNPPTEKEFEIIEPFLDSEDDALKRDLRNSLFFSSKWVKLFNELNLIIPWLEDEDKRIELMNGIIGLINYAPEIMLLTLKHFANSIIEWVPNKYSFLNGLINSNNQKLFNKFIEFIDIGCFDNLKEREDNIWSRIYDLSKNKPNKAAEVIGHYLERRYLQLPDDLTHKYHVFEYEMNSCKHIIKTAKNAPELFLNNILPIFLKILNRSVDLDKKNKGFPLTMIWGFRFFKEDDSAHQMDEAMFMGLEKALCQLALDNPAKFEEFKNDLISANFEPANFLLIRAYTAGAKHFANEAIEYVCEKTYRLQSDWSSGGQGDYQYWPGYELIKACSNSCTDESFKLLEKTLLKIQIVSKIDPKHIQRYQDLFQFMLLSGMNFNRTSDKLKKKLMELQRKLNKKSPIKPTESNVICVGSPIASDKAEKMTNKQWLKAIKKYNTEEREHRFRDGLGGAIQLSSVLKEETKKDPNRFCNLLLHFPKDINKYYYNHILMALATPICKSDKEDVFNVVKMCHKLPNKPCGQWICRPISKFAKEDIPNDILDIVAWYAINDPDPLPEELINDEASADCLIGSAINCVRGVAAEHIAILSWDTPERQKYFKYAIDSLITDPSAAVRALTANILRGMINKNRPEAIDLFIKLCDIDDDRLLATQYVENFIIHTLNSNFNEIFPLVSRMISSDIPEVRESGSRILTGFRLKHDIVQKDFIKCLNSKDENLRIGIAKVVADYIENEKHTKFCQDVLAKLFNDTNDKVLENATRCFYNLNKASSIEFKTLITNFIESSSFKQYSGRLIGHLEEITTQLPDITFVICNKILELNLKDLQYRKNFHEGGALSTLLFRIYKQTKSASIKTQCLDMIDELLKVHLWGIDDELSKFNR